MFLYWDQNVITKGHRHRKNRTILTGFGDAFRGIWITFREERHMQFHFIFAILVILCAAFFDVSAWEWCAILGCIALVFLTEIINTALENLCDVVHQEENPMIRNVKDMAAGAVLVCAIVSIFIGLIIFLPKIGELFV